MKIVSPKKLALKKSTLRTLAGGALAVVAGGGPPTTYQNCGPPTWPRD